MCFLDKQTGMPVPNAVRTCQRNLPKVLYAIENQTDVYQSRKASRSFWRGTYMGSPLLVAEHEWVSLELFHFADKANAIDSIKMNTVTHIISRFD